jgi:hypothetical protein
LSRRVGADANSPIFETADDRDRRKAAATQINTELLFGGAVTSSRQMKGNFLMEYLPGSRNIGA